MSVVSTAAPSHIRLVSLKVVAVGYAVLTGIASFGLPSLVTSWSTSGDELQLRTAYVVWGVLAGLLIPGLALSLLARPSLAVWRALAALLVGTVAAMALAFERENLGYATVVVGPAVALLLLHPRAREAARPASADRVSLAIATLMAVPLLWYGTVMAGHSRATSYVDTMHGQYAQGAVLAFTLVLMSLSGALRRDGRGIVVTLVSLSAGALGVAGILFPHDAMSLGIGWGGLTVAAAVGYAASFALRARR